MPVPLTREALGHLPAGVEGPRFAPADLSPGILHVGVGNFHRAHMQVYLQRLFDRGLSRDWGVVGAGVRPADAAMRERLCAQDHLFTVVELDPTGLTARVVGAMTGFAPVEPAATIAAMADPRIRIVSLTVTEGGWFVDARTDGFDADHPDIRADAAAPETPRTAFGMILAALRARRTAGHAPFTVLSCDNLPHNGAVARRTVAGLARLQDPAFADWVEAEVAFPNSMVDCITPATTDRERALVADRFGLIDAVPVACEPFRQWVLEDVFPQGRPALEAAGAEFVADVAPYELMKLRILNGGHAAIAYPAALLGHHFVHDAMADPRIAAWLEALTTREIQPTLAPIPGVSYDDYRRLIRDRFANPEVGDTIPRLALDGSNRQPKFILPTIRDALAQGRPVEGLALEVALWCRYCAGTDEAGRTIPPNDESWETLRSRALAAREDPGAFLSQARIFGDLGADPRFAAAFGEKLRSLWSRGVAATLADYVGG
ncbi:Mannitol-1-phosphate/altronate dehydrogenase [Rubellimicrobium thermophilum DSM 16684]|uniref:Mannitol-1-phosphate/altronate dehydrogenase n=1 Tax=Rubellimicrobium thermophilum DSM 16684 TaxID=1123069 RepID=S9QSG9_9RHOB|nr:mannitol dehydrogenase family protein [Rubellimicrobium thermophilum]EPX84346.1 Mannitol-1-phosphate/altronate dehydrogenase [Rubellimicrobium thermophilum DSM 16684]